MRATPIDTDTLIEQRKNGMSVAEISKTYGISANTIYIRFRIARFTHYEPTRTRRWTIAAAQRILKGETVPDIARSNGMTTGAVYRRLQRNGYHDILACRDAWRTAQMWTYLRTHDEAATLVQFSTTSRTLALFLVRYGYAPRGRLIHARRALAVAERARSMGVLRACEHVGVELPDFAYTARRLPSLDAARRALYGGFYDTIERQRSAIRVQRAGHRATRPRNKKKSRTATVPS